MHCQAALKNTNSNIRGSEKASQQPCKLINAKQRKREQTIPAAVY